MKKRQSVKGPEVQVKIEKKGVNTQPEVCVKIEKKGVKQPEKKKKKKGAKEKKEANAFDIPLSLLYNI